MRKNKLILVVFTQFLLISTVSIVNFTTHLNNMMLWNIVIINSDKSTSSSSEILGTDNGTLICNSSNNQNEVKICSDGEGGAIIVWRDFRNDTQGDIYAQRIDSTNNIRWSDNGIIICNAINSQLNTRIISDGEGGAIITWSDLRTGLYDVYAQKVNSNGIVQWGNNGTIICNSSGTVNNWQLYPAICSDGAGGAIITWRDTRAGAGNWDVYAQLVNSTGHTKWTSNGVPICTVTFDQEPAQICSDGDGGAIITWRDHRTGSNWDIYAQRIMKTGGLLWNSNGEPICTNGQDQLSPQICCSGNGGAIITWYDYRSTTNWDIYAQRINWIGDVQWQDMGIPLCTNTRDQYNPQICSDGADGAIITWYDYRSTTNWDIYAQRINWNGDVQWNSLGVPLCTESNDQMYPEVSSDGAGSAVIAWTDQRGGDKDIYAQFVNSSGEVQDTDDGIPICSEVNNQESPKICCDENGDAIIAWLDNRTGVDYDIYAQHIANIQTQESQPKKESNILIIPLFNGDISELLLSPLGLGIIGGIAAYLIIATILLAKKVSKNNEQISIISKKIGTKSKINDMTQTSKEKKN